MECTHWQITTAVHRLEAATLAATADQDTILDSSDTATDDDNEQDLCEEGGVNYSDSLNSNLINHPIL